MTTLEAVNFILRQAGGLPVANLNTGGPSREAEAERCLDVEELRIQTRGWVYNTRRDVVLTPETSDSKIHIPPGVITIDSYGQDAWRNVTQLGAVILDLDNNTETFNSSLHVEYILRYDFDCIPEPVAQYIACEAALTFCQNQGVRDLARIVTLRQDRDRALGAAERSDGNTADANILDTAEAMRIKGNRSVVGSRIFGTPSFGL